MEWIINKVVELLNYVMKLLPVSPFHPFIEQLSDLPYLGFLNWFIPISDILKVGTAWLVSVGLFYLYSVIMRWVKLIGD